jgi:O-antigen/teichoic acid export membrane protein
MTKKHANLYRALAVFLVKVGFVLAGFVLIVFVTRHYDSKSVGQYFWVLSSATILSALLRFGQENELIKRVAQSDESHDVAFLTTKVLMLLLVLSLTLFCIFLPIYLIMFDELLDFAVIFIIASTSAAIGILCSTLQAKGYAVTQQCLLNIPRTLALIFALSGVMLFNGQYSLKLMLVPAFLIGLGLTFVIYRLYGFSFFVTRIGLLTNKKQTLNYLMIGFSVVIIAESAIVMLGLLSEANEVALLGVASRLSYLVIFILLAFNSVIAPQFAQLYKNNQISKLIICYQKARRQSLVIALLLASIFFCASDFLLAFFGAYYQQADVILAILLLTQVVKVAVGSAGQLLMMSGYVSLQRRCILSGVFILITFSFLLIPYYGALGASIAVLMSASVNNLLALYFVNKYLSIPFSLAKSQ